MRICNILYLILRFIDFCLFLLFYMIFYLDNGVHKGVMRHGYYSAAKQPAQDTTA